MGALPRVERRIQQRNRRNNAQILHQRGAASLPPIELAFHPVFGVYQDLLWTHGQRQRMRFVTLNDLVNRPSAPIATAHPKQVCQGEESNSKSREPAEKDKQQPMFRAVVYQAHGLSKKAPAKTSIKRSLDRRVNSLYTEFMSVASFLSTRDPVLRPARVERVVGDSLIYVTAADGSRLSFRSSDLVVDRDGRLLSYHGELLDELDVAKGARVETGTRDDGSDFMVVRVRRPSLWRRLFGLA